MIGMAELLLGTELSVKQRKYALNIKGSGEALLTVINDVLDFSKIEASQLDLESIDFDLAEMVGDLAEAMSFRTSEKQLELLCHMAHDVPTYLCGDPNRLRQILTNLVGNAIKFTDRGEVSIAVTLERQGESEVVIRFKVTDTGIGIPPHAQGKIFEAFSQADNSVSRRFGGTGLGLSISKRLPDMNGIDLAQTVREESAFDQIRLVLLTSFSHKDSTTVMRHKGFAASLTKPIKPNELQEALYRALSEENEGQGQGDTPGQASMQPAPSDAMPALRLLLAEDNEINQDLVLGILEKAGLTADVVEDGVKAVQAFRRDSDYDLILMDCQMPQMSGFEATAEVRRLEATGRRVPIIALTAHAMKGDRERCLSAGMDDYITKPLNPDLLIDKIYQWTAREHPGARPAKLGVTSRRKAAPECPQPSPPAPVELSEPPVAASSPAPVTISDPSSSQARKRKILVADDNQVILELATDFLGERFIVDTVSNGQEAVNAFSREVYDLILMDGYMPLMNGYEAAAAIRRHENGQSHVPIIAVTGSCGGRDLERLKQYGIDDYLIKPYQMTQLFEKVEQWLPPEEEEPETEMPATPENVFFDYEALLARGMGDENLARRLMRKFSEQIGADLKKLWSAMAAADAPAVAQAAHRLKGAAGNLTFEELRGALEQLEQHARAGTLDEGMSQWMRIEQAVQRFQSEVIKDL